MTLKPANSRLWLAQRARDLAVGINPLFHGTRYANAILAAGTLVPDRFVGDPVVCFSRSPFEAAFWATLPRDVDEGRGAVLVFDRNRLAMRYRLEPCDNAFFDVDEQEEWVWGRDIPLSVGLVGIASQRFLSRNQRVSVYVCTVTVKSSRLLGSLTIPLN